MLRKAAKVYIYNIYIRYISFMPDLFLDGHHTLSLKSQFEETNAQIWPFLCSLIVQTVILTQIYLKI